jgi:hypothetical protein
LQSTPSTFCPRVTITRMFSKVNVQYCMNVIE